MYRLALGTGLLTVLFAGAIFGFFYAWICSTMWGLDAADPRIAIAAMQAMNASVRNAVFAPAFFGTPLVLALAGVFSLMSAQRAAGVSFFVAALTYALGGMVLTFLVNVPMNQELAGIPVPEDLKEAATLWRSYSEPWQMWNQTRAVFSGLSLLLAATGLVLLGRNQHRA
ncbi:anthrone oxygenase family protein [Roseibium sp. FZY0029]|uniref:anthrone oxygenase family protein n=1 Tax=Roseibium sp. FZY0029 TaxID=3116647 RepID=UPI002EA56224|nr:anthrone oxygenase family protein [Roseibium sp. FZY0029]